jgi:hypothetical protein
MRSGSKPSRARGVQNIQRKACWTKFPRIAVVTFR